jgi:hypothetical protein
VELQDGLVTSLNLLTPEQVEARARRREIAYRRQLAAAAARREFEKSEAARRLEKREAELARRRMAALERRVAAAEARALDAERQAERAAARVRGPYVDVGYYGMPVVYAPVPYYATPRSDRRSCRRRSYPLGVSVGADLGLALTPRSFRISFR